MLIQKIYNQNMRRLFVNQISQEMPLAEKDLHYLKTVLRLTCGTEISIFDGTKEGIARIQKDKLVLLQVTKTAQEKTKIKLAVAQIQQTRMEWLIEKATEIGVDEIFILKTQRVQKSVKFDRLEKIAQSAATQSLRITIPVIHKIQTLSEFIEKLSETWYFGHIDGLSSDAGNVKNIMIGPEGGWSLDEIAVLQKKCIPLKLSENVLRTETAAIIGLLKLF